MPGSTPYEIKTRSDWGLQHFVGRLHDLIDELPDLNAAFDLVSSHPEEIERLSTSVTSLDTARATNADARLIEDIIRPAYGYSLRDKILLGAVFDRAVENGHSVSYHRQNNGHVAARIAPKPL